MTVRIGSVRCKSPRSMDSMADYGRNKRCRVPSGPYECMPPPGDAAVRGLMSRLCRLDMEIDAGAGFDNIARKIGAVGLSAACRFHRDLELGQERERKLMNTIKRSMLGAAAVMVAVGLTTALAQTPPGFSPLDRSNPSASNQDGNLRPHPTPPLATAVDKLPLDKIKLPAGFKAEVWSSGHPAARTMVMGTKGTMFMGTRTIGRVYAITEKDGKREPKVLLQGLTQPNGLAFRDGSLYVFAINRVL